MLLDIAIRDEHMKLIEATDEALEIKGLVVINDTDFDEEAAIQEFLELVRSCKPDSYMPDSGFYKEATIAKFRNALGQRMLLSITMSKPQVEGIHGDVTG